jgi:hypothetical protein
VLAIEPAAFHNSLETALEVKREDAHKECIDMAAKKMKKVSSKPSKSAFVRGLPTTLSAKEVVAKAKAAGLQISDRYVHVIRSIAKRSAKNGNGATTVVRRGGRPISSKRTFVLGLPSSMPASEVISRAKAQGMTLTTNYVYKIRSRGAAASERPVTGLRATAPKLGRGSRLGLPGLGLRPDGAGVQEERFVALVLEVGLSRAGILLDQLRDRVQGLAAN